jgi:hypothetical protein
MEEEEEVPEHLHHGSGRPLQQRAHPQGNAAWIAEAVVGECGLTGWWKAGTGRSPDVREEEVVVVVEGSRLAGNRLLQAVLVRAGETV